MRSNVPVLYCASAPNPPKQIRGFGVVLVVRAAPATQVRLIGNLLDEHAPDDFKVTGFQDSFFLGGIGSEMLTDFYMMREGELVAGRPGEFPEGDGGLVFKTPADDIANTIKTLRNYKKSKKASDLSMRIRNYGICLPERPSLLDLPTFFASNTDNKMFESSDIKDIPFQEILYFPAFWGGYGCHFYAYFRDRPSLMDKLREAARRCSHDFREVEQADIPMS